MTGAPAAGALCAVVVSLRPQHHLARCLDSLEREGIASVVVDNGSGGRVSEVVQRFSSARGIELPRNRGFAAGANAGMRLVLAKGEVCWLLLLNDDAWLVPGSGEALASAVADTPPEVAMLAPLRLRADEPERIDSAGLEMLEGGGCRDWMSGEPRDSVSSAPREIFGPSGGAALYRRSLLEQVGLFEESFFAYFEDVDLAWRARARGYRALLLPEVQVMHVGGATALVRPWRRQVWLERNRMRCAVRYLPARELFAALATRPLRTAQASRAGAWIGLAHLEAWARALGRLPADLRVRVRMRGRLRRG